ncbi:hypothetical protein MBLNU13_g01903t1 [Cladosporium sp. NU13]
MSSPPQSQSQSQQEDPFDTLLSLESQYHAEGRALGISEGSLSGRIEGRVFGLEKSFEKFIELGKLGGRAAVWNARLPPDSTFSSATSASASAKLEVGKEEPEAGKLGVLPGSGSERLVRHVKRMAELTDQHDVSRENSEEGVQDFDDRLREARAKAVLVERLVGEGKEGGVGGAAAVKRAGIKSNAVKSDEMEDFGGLPRGVLQK